MLYNLIRKWRGKETLMMTDDLSKVNDKRKKLLMSQRKGIKGQQVTYTVKPAEVDDVKYEKPPADMYLSGQPRYHPRVPKK